MISVDNWLESAGALGLWQGVIFSCVAISQYFEAMTNIGYVFMAYTPHSRCIEPVHDDVHNSSIYTIIPTCYVHPVANNSSPVDAVRCKDWQYDKSVLGDTLVTEWDLVCDLRYRAADTQLVYLLGFIVGSMFCGMFSDWLGRKILFVTCGCITGVLGVLMAQAPTLISFLILRFLVSFFNTATFQSGFVLCMETTTSKYRSWIGGAFYIPYALGYTSLSAIAYWLKDWRKIQTFISAPIIFDLFFWWILPESPSWLVQKGRIAEAKRVIERGARCNGKTVHFADDDNDSSNQTNTLEDEDECHCDEKFWTFLSHRILVIRYSTMCFVWFVVALVYYGISFMVAGFSGDVFVNNAICGAVEVPAYILCFVLLKAGRRMSMVVVMAAVALAFLIVPFAEGDWKWAQFAIAMLGKLGVTACFAIIYVFTTELYPTAIRNTGLSISAMCGRIGSCLAPYIAIDPHDKSKSSKFLLMFAGLSLLTSLVCLVLPETKNLAMPNTIKEALFQRSFGRLSSNSECDDSQVEQSSDQKRDKVNNSLL